MGVQVDHGSGHNILPRKHLGAIDAGVLLLILALNVVLMTVTKWQII
jgi:hypothetical protein